MEYKDIVDLLDDKHKTGDQDLNEETLEESSWSPYANRLRELEIDLLDLNGAINQLYDLLKVRMKLNNVIISVKNINEKFKQLENETNLDVVIDVLAEIETDARKFDALTRFGMDDYRQLIKILPSYYKTLDDTYAIVRNLMNKIPGIRKMQKGKRFFSNAADAIRGLFR